MNPPLVPQTPHSQSLFLPSLPNPTQNHNRRTDEGLLCDLLWSDPDPEISGWAESDRGVSYVFGDDVLAEFLDEHGLDLVCRAHQVVEDG